MKITNINIIALFLVSLCWPFVSCNAEGQYSGPTELVEVVTKETSSNIYELTIKNKHSSRIRNLVLGDGSKLEWRVVPQQIPSIMEMPEGWLAHVVFKPESDFMHIYFGAKNKENFIAPETTLTGIKIKIPEYKPDGKDLFYPDGSKLVPVDVNRLPFRVQFDDFKYVWGRVNNAAEITVNRAAVAEEVKIQSPAELATKNVHEEKKSSLLWLFAVGGVVLLGLVAYFIRRRKNTDDSDASA